MEQTRSIIMKKLILAAIFILLSTAWGLAGNFSVNLNINYNYGISDFFEESKLHLSRSGLNFIETKQNNLGLGFNFSLNIPILKRIYLSPGVGMYFGNQQYGYTQTDAGSQGEYDLKDTYYFKHYFGEISLQYDLLVLRNGWSIGLLVGANYNDFKPDSEMRLKESKYWGMQTGIIARFLQLKHLGFQAAGYYKKPFNPDFYSFIGAQAGVFYKL